MLVRTFFRGRGGAKKNSKKMSRPRFYRLPSGFFDLSAGKYPDKTRAGCSPTLLGRSAAGGLPDALSCVFCIQLRSVILYKWYIIMRLDGFHGGFYDF